VSTGTDVSWVALPSVAEDPSFEVLSAAADETDELLPEDLGLGPSLVAALEDLDDDEALSVARSVVLGGPEGGVV
jgi:hypothetical protein